MAKNIHEGRNVKRFREMLGIKQEALAIDLGSDWNQKKISMLEAKEQIEPALLHEISAVLKIPVEAFQNFDEEKVINIISNNSFDNCEQPASIFYNSTINPIEKWMEALEEIKRLNAEVIKVQDAQVKMLHSLLNKKY